MRRPAPAAAGTNGRRPPVAARAFTLIEILVVIGIVLLLMGLVIGSVVRGPKLQRMIAAEQVVADCVRQARHTARTSGQPVVLTMRKTQRDIGGLSRKNLLTQVDKWPDSEEEDETNPGTWSRFGIPGRTGTGIELPGAYTDKGILDTARLKLAGGSLAGGERMWRGQPRPTSEPALVLSCAVRPPMASATTQQVLPLLLVADDAAGDPASYDESSLGLALVLSTQLVEDGPKSTKSVNKTVASWEVIGWFGKDVRTEISSISDKPADQAAMRQDQNKTIVKRSSGDLVEFTESYSLAGGRWTEITLMVEPGRMVLYRDGRRIGEKVRPACDLPVPATERLWVGVATLKASETPTIARATTIDDVQLDRLGSALAGTLPSGVSARDDYRITCHPDGKVEVNGANAAIPTDGSVDLVSETGEGAIITINPVGRVTSEAAVAP